MNPSNAPIAFTGLATSGKSTAAQHLALKHGHARLSFAFPIRKMLMELGLTMDDLTLHKEEPHPILGGKTPRWAMQSLGTQWGRDLLTPELWVNAARHRVKMFQDIGATPVFDDCRFDNEARMIRELGGLVIEITRPGLIRGTHESERGVSCDLVNFTISNDGSAERLATDLDYILFPKTEEIL